MRKVLEMMYSDILEFHQRAVRFFSDKGEFLLCTDLNRRLLILQGTVWRQIFKSIWKDFKTRFQHILDRLREHRVLIESQATLLHFQQYQADRVRLLHSLDKSEEDKHDKKYKEVLEWISGAKFMVDHESACDVRSEYPDSGHWILKNNKLQNWRHADTPISSLLWLNGIPGAGMLTFTSNTLEIRPCWLALLTPFRQDDSGLCDHPRVFA
jgi:hypothetical protein